MIHALIEDMRWADEIRVRTQPQREQDSLENAKRCKKCKYIEIKEVAALCEMQL
jgi:hypothetical protein